MLSILIGLDGSEASSAATTLGIDWARRNRGMLVGIGIIDEPTIARAFPVMVGGPPYTDPILYRQRMADARRQVGGFLESFTLACAQAGVASKVLEDVGLPSEEIVREAQRYDLIVLGARTQFHFEVQDRVDETLSRVIRDSPRPVVVVPADCAAGQTVLIAFDGSLQAARALQVFIAAGLHRTSDVHVLTIAEDRMRAAVTAERAIDYLDHHDVQARAHALAAKDSVATTILNHGHQLGAGLIVMGAYGQPVFKQFILGSVTRSVLRESRIPLLLSH